MYHPQSRPSCRFEYLRRSFNLDGNEALNGKVNLDYMIDQTAPPDSSFVYHNFRNGLGELGLEGVLYWPRNDEPRLLYRHCETVGAVCMGMGC